MPLKARILWGLAGIAFLASYLGAIALVISRTTVAEKHRLVHETTASLLTSKCNESLYSDCQFAKKLAASLVGAYLHTEDAVGVLEFRGISASYLDRESCTSFSDNNYWYKSNTTRRWKYTDSESCLEDGERANRVIEGFAQDEKNAEFVVSNVITNHEGLIRSGFSNFSFFEFVADVKKLNQTMHATEAVGIGGMFIALLATVPLVLAGIWTLLVAVTRSGRKGWGIPGFTLRE